MAWQRPSARIVVVVAMVFILGLVAGAFAFAAVASRASRASLHVAKIQFLLAQERQASEAWRKGDVEEAAGHAFCAVEVEHGAGADAFGDGTPWDPFGLAFTQALILEPNRQAAERSSPSREAVARAMLAVTWERLGRAEAAEHELDKAAALIGAKGVESLRELGLKTVALWSTVKEQEGADSAPPVRAP